MPKYPDPRSKTTRLVLVPKPEWEVEIRAFKEICARNGISISEELYQRGVETFLRDHNWPPGNSQTTINGYTPQQKPIVLCACGQPAMRTVHFAHKPSRKVCLDCFGNIRRKEKDPFSWRKIK